VGITQEWLTSWAGQYGEGYDEALEDLEGRRHFTLSQAELVVGWKSPRSLGYFRRNRDAAVRRATSEAFAAKGDVEALAALLSLQGVRERVASAILMARDQQRFTVMDRRALASLTKNHELKGVSRHDLNSWFRLCVPRVATSRRNEMGCLHESEPRTPSCGGRVGARRRRRGGVPLLPRWSHAPRADRRTPGRPEEPRWSVRSLAGRDDDPARTTFGRCPRKESNLRRL
jgi:hypothetical protein